MLLSFDLEIAKSFPEYQCPNCLSEDITVHEKMAMCSYCKEIKSVHLFRSDWKNHMPLGISCAAIQSKSDGVRFWQKPDRMSQYDCVNMIHDMQYMVEAGYTFVTWNGASFDYAVMANESGLYKECAELALNHIDLMFIVVTLRGHYLGLDKACKGANIQGKLHDVTLTDGTKLTDMSGGKAPGLWKAGEYQAVLDYLADDVRSTLELAEWIQKNKMIRWISERGYEQKIPVPKLYTVRECLELNPVLPSWVTNPVDRRSMMEWVV